MSEIELAIDLQRHLSVTNTFNRPITIYNISTPEIGWLSVSLYHIISSIPLLLRSIPVSKLIVGGKISNRRLLTVSQVFNGSASASFTTFFDKKGSICTDQSRPTYSTYYLLIFNVSVFYNLASIALFVG